MKRGHVYRVFKPGRRDPKKYRCFVIVSRQTVIDSKFSMVICAPIYTRYDGLSTQVPVGVPEGLKQDSSIHCDELISLPKSLLSDFLGSLSQEKTEELNEALKIALSVS